MELDFELIIAYIIATSMLLFILIYSLYHLLTDMFTKDEDYDEKTN